MNTNKKQLTTQKRSVIFLIVVIGAALGLIALTRTDVVEHEEIQENTNTGANNSSDSYQNSTDERQKFFDSIFLEVPNLVHFSVTSTKESETIDTVEFTGEGGNVAQVLPSDFAGIIGENYGNRSSEEIAIDGQAAQRISGTSQKDGALVEYILFSYRERTYFIRGSSDFLNEIEEYLQLQ